MGTKYLTRMLIYFNQFGIRTTNLPWTLMNAENADFSLSYQRFSASRFTNPNSRYFTQDGRISEQERTKRDIQNARTN